MCSMSVLCPLCAQTSFTSIDALRNSLIKAANGPLACPICNELFLGLDKLTIHLFSHTNLMTQISNNEQNNEEKTITTARKPPVRHSTDIKVCAEEQEKNISDSISNSLKKKKEFETSEDQENPINRMMTSQNPTEDENTASSDALPLATCDVCEFTFRTELLRDMHFRLVHQNSPQPTTTASTNFNSSTMQADPNFKCHLCAKTFKMKGSLRVHLKVVHMMGLTYVNNSNKLGICDRIRHRETRGYANLKCVNPKPNPTKPNFQQPMVSPTMPTTQSAALSSSPIYHAIEPSPRILNASNETSSSAIKDNTPNNSKSLLIPKNANADSSKETFGKTSVDNPKIWECDVCSKAFTTKYFLKKHKRLHTGEMPYTCEICGRTFTFQQSYHKHLLYHSDEKPHICATCGRAFKELSTLHNHERIHSGEKPFRCDICGKCFRQRVSFLVHSRIHTGAMPYKCEECQKSFRYKVSLRTHKCVPPAIQANAICGVHLPVDVSEAENFIKSYLESTTSNPNPNCHNLIESHNSPASLEIAAINDLDCQERAAIDPKGVEAMLLKTIDDIVVESCNKMGIGNNEEDPGKGLTNAKVHPQVLLEPPTNISSYGAHLLNENSSLALQKLQDMRLYSPKFDIDSDGVENNGSFSQFLGSN